MKRNSSIVRALRQAGFKGDSLRTAYGIVMRESGGRPDAFNPNRSTGDQSYGLFQINMLGDLGPSRRKQYGLASNEQLLDPTTNAKVAFQLSKGGTDFGAWGIGPNAYRAGAGYDTIKKYVDEFPGGALPSGQTGLGAPSRTQAGTSRADLFAQAVREGQWKLGKSSLADTARLVREQRALAQSQPGEFNPVKPPKPGKYADILPDPSSWKKGSHVTDGLDWNKGRKTAVDIMAAPGSTVGAPEDGEIIRHGSAQGGQALYFRGKSGRTYWLGHIDGMAPVGSRVSRGQPIAVISADHPAPHLHFDMLL